MIQLCEAAIAIASMLASYIGLNISLAGRIHVHNFMLINYSSCILARVHNIRESLSLIAIMNS